MRNATHRALWSPVLGTDLHLQLDVDEDADHDTAGRAEGAVLQAFADADAELSLWRADSALARWCDGRTPLARDSRQRSTVMSQRSSRRPE